MPPPPDDNSTIGDDEDEQADADDPPDPTLPSSDRDELPDHLTQPAGLLGEIVDFIVASAQRPSPPLALGAAICVVGTIIGRRVAGPTKSGTHQYVAMLAPSAAGKDHPLKRACDLIRLANDRLVGPGEFTSQQGLLRWMTDSPLSLCPPPRQRSPRPTFNSWSSRRKPSFRSARRRNCFPQSKLSSVFPNSSVPAKVHFQHAVICPRFFSRGNALSGMFRTLDHGI